jgi:hypothetical protein
MGADVNFFQVPFEPLSRLRLLLSTLQPLVAEDSNYRYGSGALFRRNRKLPVDLTFWQGLVSDGYRSPCHTEPTADKRA